MFNLKILYDVLRDMDDVYGEAKCLQTGFVFKKGSIYTYKQLKQGLSACYLKREILENLVNSIPLKL